MSTGRTSLESLEMARELICEAKGFEGPNSGSVTDHLDAAEGWLDDAQNELQRLLGIEKELWRLSLVIESAVRNADPQNRPDVLSLLNLVKRPERREPLPTHPDTQEKGSER